MNRKPIWTLAALAAVGLAALALTNQTFATFAIAGTPAGDAAIARGKYLVTIAGCNDCHTPWA